MGCMEKNTPNALMNTAEHRSHSGISSSLENAPALLRHKGFILSRILTSQRKRMRAALALSHLCWVLQVQSNTEQNTVFLIKRKIHSWHCIRWVPKAFQGQMKRLMAPSWGAAAPSSIHCQSRRPDQGRGCVVTEAPEPQATQLCSLALLHSKSSTREDQLLFAA